MKGSWIAVAAMVLGSLMLVACSEEGPGASEASGSAARETSMTRTIWLMDLAAWIDGYRRAWEGGDTDLVLTLFTEDASYRSSPFDDPHIGHDGIRAYWDGVTSQQRDVRVRMGQPFADGDRVAVEWWTTMQSEGEEVTLPGCLLLRFEADGRCSDLREYWNFTGGRVDPFLDWGT